MSILLEAIESMTGSDVKTLFSREEFIIVVFNKGGYSLYSAPNLKEIKLMDDSLKDVVVVYKSGKKVSIQNVADLLLKGEFDNICKAEASGLNICAVFRRVSNTEFVLINNIDGVNVYHYIKKNGYIIPYLSLKPEYISTINVMMNTMEVEREPSNIGGSKLYRLSSSDITVVYSNLDGVHKVFNLCDNNNDIILSVDILNRYTYIINTCSDERIFEYFEYLRDNNKTELNFGWLYFIADLLYKHVDQSEPSIDYGKRIGDYIMNSINSGRISKPSDISRLISSLYVEDTFKSLLENIDKESTISSVLQADIIS